MKISLPNEAEPGFQMAPMIDITFLLIIFFMLVAQQTQNQFKQIENPIAENSVIAQERGDRAVVTIGADEDVYLGAYPATLDDIKDMIRKRVALNPLFKMQLRIDARVRHEKVREVLGACAEAGVLDVIFSTYQSDK
ncbi:MAG: biopolymer transporter ExbD [Kiritimatiellae bacterium]|nr:biopolymer transporter ExbD [Kiritimatiellia bacterium]